MKSDSQNMQDLDEQIRALREELSVSLQKEAELRKREAELQKIQNDLQEIQRVLQKKVDTLTKENAELEAANASLQANLEWFRKKLFGKMSEKHLPIDPTALEPTLFDMSLTEEEQKALDAEVVRMEEDNAKTIEVKPHTREVRKPIYSNLPVKEIHIYPEGINMDDYAEIGVETSDSLAIKPAEMYIKRIVRHKMVLKSKLHVENPDRQAFEIAPLPDMPIYKSMASESLLADILINKYIYHLPFYRQIQKYKELGVVLSDATINDWFIAVCSKLLPIYDRLRLEIMSQDYIQVDESTLPVIDNEKHRAVKGYMWAVRDAIRGLVYFHYDKGSRSGDTARKLIGSYRGTVQTDGYEVYNTFEGAPGKRLLGCWAHVRRKFVEALDEDRKHASEALVYIGKLYELEANMNEAGMSYDQKRTQRQEKAYPVIEEFERWLISKLNAFGKNSRMAKAVGYTYALLPRLGRYVNDGKYNIDNNGVENAIRPLALGRKNYLFCGNHDAAVRAAVVYSLFSSCKAFGIDERAWLEDVLVCVKKGRDGKISNTPEELNALLPSNWQPLSATSK